MCHAQVKVTTSEARETHYQIGAISEVESRLVPTEMSAATSSEFIIKIVCFGHHTKLVLVIMGLWVMTLVFSSV